MRPNVATSCVMVVGTCSWRLRMTWARSFCALERKLVDEGGQPQEVVKLGRWESRRQQIAHSLKRGPCVGCHPTSPVVADGEDQDGVGAEAACGEIMT